MLRLWWWVALASWRLLGAAGASCAAGQWGCSTGNQCVRVDKYCDGKADCFDSSDEPPRCSPCNRTYYGLAGVTYELAPRLDRLPFLCHLTFTAGGHDHGDIVQLTFVEFSVGRYEPAALDGCPDGYMQLAELGRPFTGGSWCGATHSHAVYYSETATVTASVKLFRLPPGPPPALSPALAPAQHAPPAQQERAGFKFVLRYRMVPAEQAPVRFGTVYAPLERGAVAPGTYCTRNYEECYRKPCRLQSPNYPGMYPRNVTCYWSVRQKDIPTCKHAMIAVRQEAPHKMHVKRSIPATVTLGSWNRTGLRAWRECTGERDHLIFYDGGSTNDPVLAVYCGGDWLPRVVSRGPEMLVAFHSSPYSVPLHADPARPTPLRGFQLDVDVIFTDSDSLDYVRESSRCEFHIKASSQEEALAGEWRGRRGGVRAPLHSLPPRTLCSWTFHGRPGDVIWIYFVSYTHYSLVGGREENRTRVTPPAPAPAPVPAPPPCLTSLTVWDGGGDGAGSPLLGRACEGEWPRLCETGLRGAGRACGAAESYRSSGPQLALGWRLPEGTALHPASFHLRYEFADTRLGGTPYKPPPTARDPLIQPAECSRLFRHLPAGTIVSPRNVLWFGRGGARWLRCVYRVEGRAGERVRLALAGAAWGRAAPPCRTERDPHAPVPRCLSRHHAPVLADDHLPPPFNPLDDRLADLRIYESPWPDVRVPVACFCADNSSFSDWQWISSSHAIELRYTISAFNITEDFRNLNFRMNFTAEPAPSPGFSCATSRRLQPPGEMLHINYPPITNEERSCGETPYFLQARPNRSVFLLTWGRAIPFDQAEVGNEIVTDIQICHTTNRLLIYSYRPTRLIRIICPSEPYAPHAALHIYSSDWGGSGAHGKEQSKASEGWGGGALSIRPVWREAGHIGFTWLEVEAARTALLRVAGRAMVAAGFSPTQTQRLQDTLANVSYWGGDDSECSRVCPELEACVSASLWCDGVAHCPSGWDESEEQCGLGARLLARLGGWGGTSRLLAGAVALVAGGALALAAAGAARRRWASWRKPGAPLLPHAPLLYEVSTVSSTASS